MASENKEPVSLPVYKTKPEFLLTLWDVKSRHLQLLRDAVPVAFLSPSKRKIPLYSRDQCEQIDIIGEHEGLPIYWKKPDGLFTESDLKKMGFKLVAQAKPTGVIKYEFARMGNYLYPISQSIPRLKHKHLTKFERILWAADIESDLKNLKQREVAEKYGCSLKLVSKLKKTFQRLNQGREASV
ncbi:MAG: hypothetical protein PHC97_00050 [Patescibacteria group bacterium]|nr:hypothetical protein [Patescibacteria group bacterium]